MNIATKLHRLCGLSEKITLGQHLQVEDQTLYSRGVHIRAWQKERKELIKELSNALPT